MKPISIEVVTRVLTSYGHCVRCEPFFHESEVGKKSKIEDVKKYPPDLIEESLRFSEVICELYQIYKHRIRVRLIDVQSPLGIYKSLIHGFREYPAFIVEKEDVYKGLDKHKLEEIIDKHIKATV